MATAVEDTMVGCEPCKGSGMIDGERCETCNGQGFTRIPAPDGEEEQPDLSSLTKAELVALTDERGIDSSGTKADILERLQA